MREGNIINHLPVFFPKTFVSLLNCFLLPQPISVISSSFSWINFCSVVVFYSRIGVNGCDFLPLRGGSTRVLSFARLSLILLRIFDWFFLAALHYLFCFFLKSIFLIILCPETIIDFIGMFFCSHEPTRIFWSIYPLGDNELSSCWTRKKTVASFVWSKRTMVGDLDWWCSTEFEEFEEAE